MRNSYLEKVIENKFKKFQKIIEKSNIVIYLY